MTILAGNRTDPVAPATRIATRIINQTAQAATQLVRQWEQGFDALWNNPNATPAEILVEMGTDAAEVFQLSTATAQLMAAILPDTLPDDWARIQAKLAAKPAVTAHEDGTVTIDA
jgi:hypothetical protein